MAKLTLVDLTTLVNDPSAVATINSNMQLIEQAMDKALFLNGQTPNVMTADLDLGSNLIINAKSPNNPTDGATKGYVDSLLSGIEDPGAALLRADLADTSAGQGASLVGVEDAAGNFTGTTVEDVLTELDTNTKTVLIDLADTSTGKGASLVGVEDSAGAFTATDLEALTQEIFEKSRYNNWSGIIATGTDTYVAISIPAFASYVSGDIYSISFGNANTVEAPTIDINGLGTKLLLRSDGTTLGIGQVFGQHLVKVVGSVLMVLNPVPGTGASPPTVAGYSSGKFIYAHNDGGNATTLSVPAVIAQATWESIGASGSPADNIWMAMNEVPAAATMIRLRLHNTIVPSVAGSSRLIGSARRTGSTASGNETQVVDMYSDDSANTSQAASRYEIIVPLDGSGSFDFNWNQIGVASPRNIILTVIGWIE